MTPEQRARRIVRLAQGHEWAAIAPACDALVPCLVAAVAIARDELVDVVLSPRTERIPVRAFEAYWTARAYYRAALLLEDAADAPAPRLGLAIGALAAGPWADSAIAAHPVALAALDSCATLAQKAGDAWEHARKCLIVAAKQRALARAADSVQT